MKLARTLLVLTFWLKSVILSFCMAIKFFTSSKGPRVDQNFNKRHAARIIENIFYYLTFQDVTHPIVNSKMRKKATHNVVSWLQLTISQASMKIQALCSDQNFYSSDLQVKWSLINKHAFALKGPHSTAQKGRYIDMWGYS